MNNTKFKSGDKVVFCKSSLESGMIDAKEGDVFTIKESYGPGSRVVSLKELPGYYHKTHFEHYVEKEKVMEKYIPKVGDEVKGFVFDGDDYPGIGYPESMDDVVGEHGTVCRVSEDRFVIDFGDNCWTYPLELANLAKIEESSQETSNENGQIHWQAGQEVWDCSYGNGVVSSVSIEDNKIHVCFRNNNNALNFDTIGVIYGGINRTLFFSEPKIIAERMPPKKTFVPTLKFDDKVIVINEYGRVACYGYVEKESEDSVSMRSGEIFHKDYFSFHELGEQVKFS
jgi:hypothetical protein